MTDRDLALATVAAFVVALAAPAVPWWVVAVVTAGALASRRPLVVALLLVLLVGARAHDALTGLAGARPGEVSGQITVLSDPEARFGSWEFDARRGAEHDDVAMPRSLGSAPVVGEHLRVTGAVSPLDSVGTLRARHLRARLTVTAVHGRSPPAAPLRFANATRDLVIGGASSLGVDRPLFAGLVLGDDRDQSPLLKHRFRASGLAHLLAVSGQNVAFVLVAVSPLLARLSLRGRWILTVLVLAMFTLVTRWEPSVLRAVVMAGTAATAQLRGRHASGTRRVALAVLILLVADPMLVWSLGFRLSVAATAALVLLQQPIARSLPGPHWLIDPLATVMAAQVGTAPLLLAMGATISVATFPANLVAVPVAGWVMVWGLTAGLVAGVGGPIAALIHRPTAAMLWWIREVAAVAASARWPLLGPIALTAVGLAVAIRFVTTSTAVRITAWLPAVVAIWIGALPPAAGSWADVRGAHVWRASSGQVIVASGGATDPGRLFDALTRRRIGRIDVLILTSTGPSATTLADLIRQDVDVGTVVASEGLVRNARPLVPGEVVAGDVRVRLHDTDGRWSVSGPGVA